jgi:serine/threonine protein kinase
VLKRLGKYELIEEVGRGAMGEVYKAHDPSIGRLVALKTITGSMVGDASLLERFYREARSAGTLQHPNIVTIYELGKEGDTPFIAMEFLEGESLEKVIERRPVLTLLEKVGYIVPVCRALEYAHKRGVVHRDIKPANVMLAKDGNVKVVDFGIARFADTLKTRTDAFIGTLGYMSPQQIHGERADERGDIWALGVTFYELLCYHRPFDGDNHAAIMLSIVDTDSNPVPLTDLISDCPSRLELIVGRMLEKDITQRFQTMEEVLSELEPLWKSVQEAGVSGLIADSEEAFRAEDFSRARELLRKVLQIDSRNEKAKALLDRFNTEIKRAQVGSQVRSALDSAQNLLKEGRHQEAKAEAEAALRLDSTFGPARELLAEVERAAERARSVQENLQVARQRLGEGALTEAAQEIQNVLNLDATNSQVLALQKEIQGQLDRREERRRLADLLQRARKYWGEQRLDECLRLLTDSQKEFPDHPEIAKLLEAARVDLTEQEKQKKLADTRRLLAEQRVDEALAMIEPLSEQQPNDPAIQKLKALALREKDELLRDQKLRSDLGNVQSLVNAGKYSEALSRGEKLLQEFPGRAELIEFVSAARRELAQVERQQFLKESLQTIRKKMDAGKFQDALEDAERAFARFPGEPEIEEVREQARAKHKEKETHELLQKRIGEISRNIKRGQHTDAVDLARQTLATVGQDSEVNRLLSLAEMELAGKRKKKEEQDKRVEEAQTLLLGGQVDAATQILQDGLETKIFSRKHPRVRQLLNEIQERRAAAAPVQIGPLPPVPGEPGSPGAPAGKYVYQDGTILQSTSQALHDIPSGDPAGGAFSATRVIDPGAHADQMATVQDPVESSLPVEPSQLSPEFVAAPEDSRPEDLSREPSADLRKPLSERRVPLALGVLALLVLAVAVFYFVQDRRAKEDAALLGHAQQVERQKNWRVALSEFESLSHHSGAIASEALDQARRLRNLLDQEDSLFIKASGYESGGNFSEAKKTYQEVADLHGDKEREALNAVQKLEAKKIVLEEPIPSKKEEASHKQPKAVVTEHSASIPTPESPVRNCQLIPSSYAIYLNRADSNRGRGNYADAEREYNAVLECDPQNERALSGLRRTNEAKALPGRPGN